MRKIKAALASLLLAFVVIVLPATPAQAYIPCPGGYFCLYTSYGWLGTQCKYVASKISTLHGYRLDAGYSACNNNSKSWWNESGYNISLIDANDCNSIGSGFRRNAGPYTIINGTGSDWVNRFSSIDRTGDTVLYCGATV